MARAAMAYWDDEFGYELVDADMELSFPSSDATLGHLLEGTVQTARQRQAMLAAAMPSRFERPEMTSFSIPDREHSESGPARRAPAGYGIGAGGSGDQQGGYGSASRQVGPLDGSQFQSADSGEFGGQAQGDNGQPALGYEDNAMDGAADSGGGQTGSDASDGAAGVAGVAGGNRATGQNTGNASCPVGGSGLQSMANSNGANWALPEDVSGLTAITRPIVVECHPDRLVIRPDRGDQRRPQVVPIDGTTRGAIDPFVAGIQAHMKRWGMAVAGGHWKPIVRVEVLPGAEDRFRELAILLEHSGIQVEKR
jgi:hypothetical protein